MNDRKSLLDAIRENPGEDAPRLMYADWIGEHLPDDPVTAPTIEFINIACRGKKSPAMPQAAYRWLDGNWQRLVPALLSRLHTPLRPGAVVPVHGHEGLVATEENRGIVLTRAGRHIYCRLNTRGKLDRHEKQWSHFCSVRMTFWKGFCTEFSTWSQWASAVVASSIRSQQPLAIQVAF